MNIGDYWDEDTVDKVTKLLHEYHDLFPTKFSNLNLKSKENVREELDKMLTVGIIEPGEESEWLSLMVFQEKKTKLI